MINNSSCQSKKIWMTQYEHREGVVFYTNIFDTPRNRLIFDLIGTLELEIAKLKGKLDVEFGSHSPHTTVNKENEE